MTNKVCFVILHYGENKKITLNAIHSIKRLSFKGIVDIIVVCNGNKFNINADVGSLADVLVLEENRGFSVGNNKGYSFAKAKDDYDFILIINNDVIIKQMDFLEKLYSLYENKVFYVAGPDIYIPYLDFHASPISDDVHTKEGAEKDIVDSKQKIVEYNKIFSVKCLKTYVFETFVGRNILSRLSVIWRKIKRNNKSYTYEQENVVLQGACIIFSRDYIKVNDKAFEPEVFLYYEEDFLALKCRRNGWRTVYTNEMQVIHYHRGSSGFLGNSYREWCKKKIVHAEKVIESAKIFKEYMAMQ